MKEHQNSFAAFPYLPLTRLSEALDIPIASLKQRLYIASRKGIPIPERKRIGKTYFYNANQFCTWLFETSETLRRDAPNF